MKCVTYIKKSTLEFSDLWNHFGMTKDKAGRWEPSKDTAGYVIEFLSEIRAPSRAWPLSYAKSMLSQKFAKLVVQKDPDLALKIGIAEEV